jgi:hypothetical protein
VTARSLSKGLQVVYIIVRGHEVSRSSPAAGGLVLPSGFTVPRNAKLQLQRLDNVTFQPLEFAPLVSLPPGTAGLLYLTTMATQTIPAGNNYIEVRTNAAGAAAPWSGRTMVRQDHGQALSQLAWSVGDGWKRRRVIGCCRGAGTCSPQPTLHGPALSWARASRTTSTLRVSVSDAPCLPCASHGASTRQPFGRHACPDFEGLWPLPHPLPKIDWSPRLNHTALVWLRADWFCALGGQGPCLFAHPTSGLLHFSRTHFNGSDWIAQPRPGANRSACTCVRRRAPTPAAPGALSLAGKQFRQACQAVSSGSQLSQSALATAHASIAGEWVPGAAQTVERLSAYRCSHRPHAPPTVHPAVPLPPNACLTGRPSVSGGVCVALIRGPLQLLRSRGGGLPGRRGAALAHR